MLALEEGRAMNPHDSTDVCSSAGWASYMDDLSCTALRTHCPLCSVFQRMVLSRAFPSRSCHQTMKLQAPEKY